MTRRFADISKPRPSPPFIGPIIRYILAAAALGAIIVVISSMLATPVRAERVASTPPHRFDHRYRRRPVVVTVPADSTGVCRNLGADGEACSWVRRGICRIVLPTGLTARERASIIRHEVGHCNGWPEDHPP